MVRQRRHDEVYAVGESTDLMAEAAEESQRELVEGGGGRDGGVLLMTILLALVKTGVRGHVSGMRVIWTQGGASTGRYEMVDVEKVTNRRK